MTIPLEDVRLEERSEVIGPWQTVVWNDPVILMS